MDWTKKIALVTCGGFLLSCTLSAQEVSPFSFNVGAGFTTPVGSTGRNLDIGWNAQAGAGYNFNSVVGLNLDFNFDHMGINSGTLNNLGFPGGDLDLWSFTLDPIVHLNHRGPVDVYLTGGGGIFHQYQEFTAPTTAFVNGFNPFFGFYTAGVPANQVLASYSVNKPGIDAGMGVAFGNRWHGKFYAEARWERVFINNFHTDAVPVTFGFRW